MFGEGCWWVVVGEQASETTVQQKKTFKKKKKSHANDQVELLDKTTDGEGEFNDVTCLRRTLESSCFGKPCRDPCNLCLITMSHAVASACVKWEQWLPSSEALVWRSAAVMEMGRRGTECCLRFFAGQPLQAQTSFVAFMNVGLLDSPLYGIPRKF